jgi:phage recombination protein Bet
METAVVVREDFQITADDVRKYFAPNATEKEFGILMGICKSFKLNPFKREVHFVKYGSSPASIITGYEIYLKRAEKTGKLDGWKCWIERDDVGEKAVVEIKRKDQSTPFRWEVYRKEFDKQQSTWKAMPTFMLKKVAIAQGFRLCFPEDLGGFPYIPEEMPQDKGGGTSETLPQAEVIEAPQVAPQDEPDDIPEEFREEPKEEIPVISEPQRKRLFAISKEAGWPNEDLKNYLQDKYGISHTSEIPKAKYEEICTWVEAHTGWGG